MKRLSSTHKLISILLSLALVVSGGAGGLAWAAEGATGVDAAKATAAEDAEAAEEAAGAGDEMGDNSNSSDVSGLLTYEGELCTEAELEELEAEDELEYSGYIFKLKDEVSAAEVEAVQENIEDLAERQVEDVFMGEMYAANSLEAISEVADADLIEYIEPDQIATLAEVGDANAGEGSESPESAGSDKDSSANTADGDSIESRATLAEVTDEEMRDYIAGRGYTDQPDDTYYAGMYGWAYYGNNSGNHVKVNKAWGRGFYGQDMNGLTRKTVVAIIDSGLDNEHPDIDYSHVLPGITILPDEDGKLVETEGAIDDLSIGHGTFVAGMIIGSMNNGQGITGFMPDLYVMPIKTFSAKTGPVSAAIRGMERAIEAKADVINLSFGVTSYSQSLGHVCKSAADKGIIMVAAAGNEGNDASVQYPAALSDVIAVGAVDSRWELCAFSCTGSQVDVVAPGKDLQGLRNANYLSSANYYRVSSGTSFACPIVSALAGMCKSYDPSVDVELFRNWLRITSDDLGTPGKDNKYGYGVVDFGEISYLFEKKPLGYSAVTFSNISPTYTGSKLKPTVKVKLLGKYLEEGRDYTVTYSDNVNVGKATVTIKAVDGSGYSGTRTAKFTIRPKGTVLATPKNIGRTEMTLKWNKQDKKMSGTGITGYQIQVARNASFTSKLRSYKLTGVNSTSRRFWNMARNTNYYARVRTYKKVDGVTYYSNWSPVKTYRTK